MGNANKRAGKLVFPLRTLDATKESSQPAQAASSIAVRWSDVAADRKSTHPDAAPIKSLLGVEELREPVLTYLALQELFRARGVCGTFRNVVDTSPTLQQTLFLKPSPWIDGQPRASCTADFVVPVVINPLLLHLGVSGSPESRAENIISDRFDRVAMRKKLYSLLTSSATPQICLNMFLSQPLVTKFQLSFSVSCRYPDWEDRRGLPKRYDDTASRLVKDEKGVKWMQVVDAARRGVYSEGRSSTSARLNFFGVLGMTSEELEEMRE